MGTSAAHGLLHDHSSSSSSTGGARDKDTERQLHRMLRTEQRIWPREFNSNELYKLETSRPTSVLQVVKGQFDGRVTGFEEVDVKPEEFNQSSESMSIMRRPARSKDFVRGSSSNMPFLPGGLEDDQVVLDFLQGDWLHYGAENERKTDSDSKRDLIRLAEVELGNLEHDGLLEHVPPGMSHGLTFDGEMGAAKAEVIAADGQEMDTIATDSPAPLDEKVIETGKNPESLLSPFMVDVDEVYQQQMDFDENSRFYPGMEQQREEMRRQIVRLDDVFGAGGMEDPFAADEEDIVKEEERGQTERIESETRLLESIAAGSDTPMEETSLDRARDGIRRKRRDSLDALLGEEAGMLPLGFSKKKQKQREWARIDKTDVSRFDEMVPDMAIEYPFDLDVFQKQAIWHLENGESVFVAAHTSAGKVFCEFCLLSGLVTSPLTPSLFHCYMILDCCCRICNRSGTEASYSHHLHFTDQDALQSEVS